MAIRVLMLDDDNHYSSYHAEDTSYWYDANHFIKYLTRPRRTVSTSYNVRKVVLADLDINNPDVDIDYLFDIVQLCGRGYSFEKYQEAFDLLWKYSEEI